MSEKATDLLESLSISTRTDKIDINRMEWKYGGANLMNQYAKTNLDSDDDSDGALDIDDYIQNDSDLIKNPLKSLASRSEVPCHPIKVSDEKALDERNVRKHGKDQKHLNFESLKPNISLTMKTNQEKEQEKGYKNKVSYVNPLSVKVDTRTKTSQNTLGYFQKLRLTFDLKSVFNRVNRQRRYWQEISLFIMRD